MVTTTKAKTHYAIVWYRQICIVLHCHARVKTPYHMFQPYNMPPPQFFHKEILQGLIHCDGRLVQSPSMVCDGPMFKPQVLQHIDHINQMLKIPNLITTQSVLSLMLSEHGICNMPC